MTLILLNLNGMRSLWRIYDPDKLPHVIATMEGRGHKVSVVRTLTDLGSVIKGSTTLHWLGDL